MISPLPRDRPLVMGVVNVTPDSFSDGGRYFERSRAIEHGLVLADEGADILDIGGESTRPGSERISMDEELSRVIPVVEGIARVSEVTLSVDTTRPEVARQAISAGAGIINDVSMLRDGRLLASEVAGREADLIIMHSRKTPRDMQEDIRYEDVVSDVCAELKSAASFAMGEGVPRHRIWLDPGIGFAKTARQNLELIARLDELVSLGYPVLVGPSRKSFIEAFTGATVGERTGGTAAAVAASVLRGARAVRVHDVALMKQVVMIAYEIANSGVGGGRDA